jgi:hypothetical protein
VKIAIVLVVAAVAGCERKKNDPPPPRAVDAATLPTVVEKVEVPEVRLRPGAPTKVEIVWTTPRGTGVNEGAPFRVRWNRSDGLAEAPRDVKATGSAAKEGFSLEVRPMPNAPNATLGGEIDLVVCDVETHSICVPVHKSVELGFMIVADASAETKIAIPLPEAKAR